MEEPGSELNALDNVLMNFTDEEKRLHAEAVIAPDFLNQMNGGMHMQNMTSLPSMGMGMSMSYNNMED